MQSVFDYIFDDLLQQWYLKTPQKRCRMQSFMFSFVDNFEEKLESFLHLQELEERKCFETKTRFVKFHLWLKMVILRRKPGFLM